MAGKSKAERKRARNSRAKPKEENAPLEHQIAHNVDPVESYMVREYEQKQTITGARTFGVTERAMTLIRAADARIRERMDTDPDRERAFDRIMQGWQRRTQSKGATAMDLTRVFGRSLSDGECSDYNIKLEADFSMWEAICKSHGVECRIVTDLFGHGLTAKFLDGFHRRRHGWAVEEMCRSLDLYCVMKGWKQREVAA